MSKKSDTYIFKVEGTSHLKEGFKNIGLKIHPEELFLNQS